MRRVLVCGGREYFKRYTVARILGAMDFPVRETHFIFGGASGADELARQWAHRNQHTYTVFPAHWSKHGWAAGPARNQEMLDKGKPDLVIAFPGGTGTADMVGRAKAANIEVMEIEE